MKSEWYGDKRLKEINDLLKSKMILVTDFVQGEAKRRCPVDTGNLWNSITKEIKEESGEVVGRIGTNVEYAEFQEFGTSKMSATPFLRPSIVENKNQITKFLT